MKKYLKRIMVLSLCACMFMGAASPASALSLNGVIPSDAWNELVTYYSQPGEPYYPGYFDLNPADRDTNHGFIIAFDPQKNVVLNQYTSGTPVNGTRVSSWKYEEYDTTQEWFKYRTTSSSSSPFFLVPSRNTDTFLEIYRTSSSSTADLVARIGSYQNNYYEDGHITLVNGDSINYGKFNLPPRVGSNGVTYNARQLKRSSTATPVLDGNNSSYYCVWSPIGETVYIE